MTEKLTRSIYNVIVVGEFVKNSQGKEELKDGKPIIENNYIGHNDPPEGFLDVWPDGTNHYWCRIVKPMETRGGRKTLSGSTAPITWLISEKGQSIVFNAIKDAIEAGEFTPAPGFASNAKEILLKLDVEGAAFTFDTPPHQIRRRVNGKRILVPGKSIDPATGKMVEAPNWVRKETIFLFSDECDNPDVFADARIRRIRKDKEALFNPEDAIPADGDSSKDPIEMDQTDKPPVAPTK
jgi:hypothetical protein